MLLPVIIINAAPTTTTPSATTATCVQRFAAAVVDRKPVVQHGLPVQQLRAAADDDSLVQSEAPEVRQSWVRFFSVKFSTQG